MPFFPPRSCMEPVLTFNANAVLFPPDVYSALQVFASSLILVHCIHFLLPVINQGRPSYTCSGGNYKDEVFFFHHPLFFFFFSRSFQKHLCARSHPPPPPFASIYFHLCKYDTKNATGGFYFLFLSVSLPLFYLFSRMVWATLQSAYRPIKQLRKRHKRAAKKEEQRRNGVDAEALQMN